MALSVAVRSPIKRLMRALRRGWTEKALDNSRSRRLRRPQSWNSVEGGVPERLCSCVMAVRPASPLHASTRQRSCQPPFADRDHRHRERSTPRSASQKSHCLSGAIPAAGSQTCRATHANRHLQRTVSSFTPPFVSPTIIDLRGLPTKRRRSRIDVGLLPQRHWRGARSSAIRA